MQLTKEEAREAIKEGVREAFIEVLSTEQVLFAIKDGVIESMPTPSAFERAIKKGMKKGMKIAAEKALRDFENE